MAADVPRPSPDFAINMNDGSQIHLSQYQGKVVVFAFILTYCSHCQFTAQILSRLQKEYGPQGLQVVASAIDPMSSLKVPDFIKQFQPGYPVGFTRSFTG
jgi:cytochrome oxidase Cu insertion factor (SCO1/SenC/PrrC family)